MKKHIAFLLVFLTILLAGCGGNKTVAELPVPEYPISQELVQDAMEVAGMPDNLSIEVNDLLKYEGIDSTSYTLRHPTKDLFAGMCLGILTHKAEEFTSLGITVSSIDQEEAFSKEEIEQSIRFASWLFWQDETDTRILDAFMKKYQDGEPLQWEKKIDGIDCRIIYNPDQRQTKFQIAFSTDMETQLGKK